MADTRPYNPKEIEEKWRKRWEESGVYQASDTGDKKAYVLDMFPYPSGAGLHVGHPKGYIATDAYSRMKRMQGHSVLHPMGWDAFGLPAEQYALQNKVHPRKAVEENVARFKEQLSRIGLDYDWSREVNTTDPTYYRWTQWIFLQLFKKGLAYESYAPINWCPSCQTGLANEDLDGGNCERCGSAVIKKPMRQWVLKITDYADRMLDDLELLPRWPDHIKEMQRNWIGRSEGAELTFSIAGGSEEVKVFTTRPDTLYGATFLVLAPEHPLVTVLGARMENVHAVMAYAKEAHDKSELERQENKEKTGVLLEGVRAINPATKEEIPVFVADYVLGGYGTGAVMGVPAHDERDHAFATKYGIEIRQVIEPLFYGAGDDQVDQTKPFVERQAVAAIVKHPTEEKYLALKWKTIAWHTFITGGIEAGQTPEEAIRAEILEETGYTDLKLVRTFNKFHSKFFHGPKNENRFGHFHPFYFELQSEAQETVDDAEKAKHEPLWLTREECLKHMTVESNRYFLGLIDGSGDLYGGDGILVNSGEFTGLENEEAKAKITAFAGGTMTKTYRLQDWVFSRQRYWGEPIPLIHCEKCGVVPVPESDLPVTLPDVEHYEPAGTGESPLANITEWVNVTCSQCGGPGKRETNTMPQWAGSCWYYLRFMDPHNDTALVDPTKEKHWAPVDVYVGGAEHATRHLIYARFWHKFLYDNGVVSTPEPFTELHSVGLILAEDGRKMSKRFGNVVNPDDVIDEWGADAFRTYEMFMGPFKDTIAWSTQGLAGPRRFIEKVWYMQDKIDDSTLDEETERLMHATVRKVGDDIQSFAFNTAISTLMIYANALHALPKIPRSAYETLILLLAPFAPHITDELWEVLGHPDSLQKGPWPIYDEEKLVTNTALVIVQINGKKRGELTLPRDASEEDAVTAVRSDSALAPQIPENPTRIVYVANRILNFIV